MAMKRKLLIVPTLAWVAPLSAHQSPATLKHHESHCPSEGPVQAVAWAPAKGATPAVVVVEGTPGAASALRLGHSPVFMP